MPLPATLPLLFLAQAAQAAQALDPAAAADPLLRPLPAAAQRVASFDQALKRLRENSDDLQIAVAQSGAATARSRQALAPLLPFLLGTVGVHGDLLHPDTAPTSLAGTPMSPDQTPMSGGVVPMSPAGAPVVPVRLTSPLGLAQVAGRVPIIDVSPVAGAVGGAGHCPGRGGDPGRQGTHLDGGAGRGGHRRAVGRARGRPAAGGVAQRLRARAPGPAHAGSRVRAPGWIWCAPSRTRGWRGPMC